MAVTGPEHLLNPGVLETLSDRGNRHTPPEPGLRLRELPSAPCLGPRALEPAIQYVRVARPVSLQPLTCGPWRDDRRGWVVSLPSASGYLWDMLAGPLPAGALPGCSPPHRMLVGLYLDRLLEDCQRPLFLLQQPLQQPRVQAAPGLPGWATERQARAFSGRRAFNGRAGGQWGRCRGFDLEPTLCVHNGTSSLEPSDSNGSPPQSTPRGSAGLRDHRTCQLQPPAQVGAVLCGRVGPELVHRCSTPHL